MDEKMLEFNEKIKNRFMHQSPGVKGVLMQNFKTTSGSPAKYHKPTPVEMPGDPTTTRSNHSRMGSYRQPPLLGIKMDRVNNRLVINDDKILSLL